VATPSLTRTIEVVAQKSGEQSFTSGRQQPPLLGGSRGRWIVNVGENVDQPLLPPHSIITFGGSIVVAPFKYRLRPE
jgi:hypothetical protein